MRIYSGHFEVSIFSLYLNLLFILSLSTHDGFEPLMEMPGAMQENLLLVFAYFRLQVTSDQFLKRALPAPVSFLPAGPDQAPGGRLGSQKFVSTSFSSREIFIRKWCD